jgi:hypothetical protein
MSFFKASFNNFGETLRTVSLAIGLLVTSVTGVGYIYNMISDQRAMAVELSTVSSRVVVLESAASDLKLDRWRIEQTEKGVASLNHKVDKMIDAVTDLKIEIQKKRD